MGKSRKRKLPITTATSRRKRPRVAAISTPKPQSTHTVIRQFHNALKHKAAILSLGDPSSLNADDARKLNEIDAEIARMGGLELYQDMSATGQRNDRGGGSEKILIGWLKKTDVITKPQTVRASLSLKGKEKADPELGYAVKLRLLEVGALEPDNYGGCSSWIDCHPIDLRSRHSGILEQDFMLLDDAANCGEWDIISLSLVLNFVGNPHDRGRMLRLAQKFLRPATGLLFVVLPLPCVSNSRYLDLPTFYGLMSALGLTLVKERWRESGKVAYWLFRVASAEDTDDGDRRPSDYSRKRVVREGGGRNNFSILI